MAGATYIIVIQHYPVISLSDGRGCWSLMKICIPFVAASKALYCLLTAPYPLLTALYCFVTQRIILQGLDCRVQPGLLVLQAMEGRNTLLASFDV